MSIETSAFKCLHSSGVLCLTTENKNAAEDYRKFEKFIYFVI